MNKYLLEIGTEELPYKFVNTGLAQLKNAFEKQQPNYCFLTHASNSFGCILEVEYICNSHIQQGTSIQII